MSAIRVCMIVVLAVMCELMMSNETWAKQHRTSDLLTFIRMLEAPGGYDDYERRITVHPPKKLTTMRVGEVLNWQRQVRAEGNPSTAAGGYQIIYKTLDRLVEQGVVSLKAPFSPAIQDRLARALIGECQNKIMNLARYGNCLAGIWSALPLVAGPEKGRSAHEGIGKNRALTRPEIVLALLAGKKVPTGPIAVAKTQSQGVTFRTLERDPVRKPITVPDTVSTHVPQKKPSVEPLARRVRIEAAMNAARQAGTLSPSVRTWNLDPYALE